MTEKFNPKSGDTEDDSGKVPEPDGGTGKPKGEPKKKKEETRQDANEIREREARDKARKERDKQREKESPRKVHFKEAHEAVKIIAAIQDEKTVIISISGLTKLKKLLIDYGELDPENVEKMAP